MNFQNAIKKATRLARNEGTDQIVGLIAGYWHIAHAEDIGRQVEMTLAFRVKSDGPVAHDLMTAFDTAGIPPVRDWGNNTAMWTMHDGTKITVSGQQVCIE